MSSSIVVDRLLRRLLFGAVLLMLTGCAAGPANAWLPGVLIFLLGVLGACRPQLRKPDLSQLALRYFFTGKGSSFASPSCSATQTFPDSFDLLTYDLAARGDGFTIIGETTNSYLGNSVSGAGDINGDGIGDLLIGSYRYSTDFGRAYVIYGSSQTSNVATATLAADAGIKISGESSGSRLGNWVSDLGDVNADGRADFALGAPRTANGGTNRGSAFVFLGKSNPADFDLNTTTFSAADGLRLNSSTDSDLLGERLAAAGDVNGDGINDIAVSSVFAGANGQAYFLYGKTAGFSTLDSASISSSDGFTVTGENSGNLLGRGISNTADVNGDGRTDIVLSAPSGDPDGGSNLGLAQIIYGQPGGPGDKTVGAISASAGFEIGGTTGGYSWGESTAAGDFNGDGIADIALGGPAAGNGRVFIVFGQSGTRSNVDLATISTPAEGIQIDGINSFDFTGNRLNMEGDLNADGYSDLIISAHAADPSARNGAGSVFVVFGKGSGLANINLASLTSPDGFRVDGAVAGDQLGLGLNSAGDINGDYCDDLILGAPYNATSTGAAYVIYGGKAQ